MSQRLGALPGRSSPARLRGMSKAHDQTLIALPWRALHQWHAGLQQAFAHIEQDDALRYLAQAIGHLVSIESVMISLERKDQPPLSLYLQGIPEQYRDSVIGRYFSVGYLLDPFCLAVEQGLAEGFYHLEEIAPDHFFDSDYYKTYYLKAGCSEDSYFIVDVGNQSKVSLSLFQGFGGETLSHSQLDVLRAVEPMVAEFIREFARRNTALVEQGASGARAQTDIKRSVQQAFEHFGCDVLTERERQVAHMILRGHSVKSTAQQMGIAIETVRMHRKNLYLKLAISSQSELFALFIEWLRQE